MIFLADRRLEGTVAGAAGPSPLAFIGNSDRSFRHYGQIGMARFTGTFDGGSLGLRSVMPVN